VARAARHSDSETRREKVRRMEIDYRERQLTCEAAACSRCNDQAAENSSHLTGVSRSGGSGWSAGTTVRVVDGFELEFRNVGI